MIDENLDHDDIAEYPVEEEHSRPAGRSGFQRFIQKTKPPALPHEERGVIALDRVATGREEPEPGDLDGENDGGVSEKQAHASYLTNGNRDPESP